PGATALRPRAESERQAKERQSRRADAERAKALAALERAEAHLYYSRIAQARLEYRANNLVGALQLLDACRSEEGQADRRGWEWHYLDRLCHADLLPPMGHSARVQAVAFSPDGRRIASAGGGNPFYSNPGARVEPGEVVVWDAATGQALLTLRGHQHLVSGVAYSPDG